MEEERRLAFVAMTRAQKALYLSEAEGRNLDGSPKYPSRFLLDIDQKLLVYTEEPRDRLVAEARDYIEASSLRLSEEMGPAFSPGARVRHAIFGTGTLVDVDLEKSAYVIQFDDMPTPRSITFRAKLERL